MFKNLTYSTKKFIGAIFNFYYRLCFITLRFLPKKGYTNIEFTSYKG